MIIVWTGSTPRLIGTGFTMPHASIWWCHMMQPYGTVLLQTLSNGTARWQAASGGLFLHRMISSGPKLNLSSNGSEPRAIIRVICSRLSVASRGTEMRWLGPATAEASDGEDGTRATIARRWAVDWGGGGHPESMGRPTPVASAEWGSKDGYIEETEFHHI